MWRFYRTHSFARKSLTLRQSSMSRAYEWAYVHTHTLVLTEHTTTKISGVLHDSLCGCRAIRAHTHTHARTYTLTHTHAHAHVRTHSHTLRDRGGVQRRLFVHCTHTSHTQTHTHAHAHSHTTGKDRRWCTMRAAWALCFAKMTWTRACKASASSSATTMTSSALRFTLVESESGMNVDR